MRLSIANHKGGAGKSTVTACLAEALAARGCRVLCIGPGPAGQPLAPARLWR